METQGLRPNKPIPDVWSQHLTISDTLSRVYNTLVHINNTLTRVESTWITLLSYPVRLFAKVLPGMRVSRAMRMEHILLVFSS